jgi:PhzF family phenazine biosynthesis protein
MQLDFETYDVFTTTVFKGNPLAIVTIPPNVSVAQELKQSIAREFNLSETVFIQDVEDRSATERRINIFTIDQELPFAGHPVIGTAVSLQAAGINTLVTSAGSFSVIYPDQGFAQVDIPHNVHLHSRTLGSIQPAPTGLSPHAVIANAELNAGVFSVVKGMTFVLVQLPSLGDLAIASQTPMKCSHQQLLDDGWQETFLARYHYVQLSRTENDTAAEAKVTYEIRTRLLEIAMEDPATGSAASALSSYLSLKEGLSGNQPKKSFKFIVTQGVEMGRESNITVETEIAAIEGGSGAKLTKLRLSGKAKRVMRGVLEY